MAAHTYIICRGVLLWCTGGVQREERQVESSEDSEQRLRRLQEDAPIQDFIARDSDATSISEGESYRFRFFYDRYK